MIQLPQPLNIPVPPMLEKVVGYEGDARYFGLYWTPFGDEVMVVDGRLGRDGNWHGYLAFIDHKAALPLAAWRDKLGSSDEEATHWLVIDRQERKAYVLPLNEAGQFLVEQYPPADEAATTPYTSEEWASLLAKLNQAMAGMPMPSVEQVRARMNADYAIECDMTAWLDANVPPETQQLHDEILAQLNRAG